MKMGWEHWGSTSGHLVLRHAPAAAFIGELALVDQLAVLLTATGRNDDTAVFDVRRLEDALASYATLWGC